MKPFSIKKIFYTLAFLATINYSLYAQDNAAASSASDSGGDLLSDTMSDITTIAAMGGAGAIIGLSTLSFKEHPSEHLKSIITGAAIGMVIGIGLVTYNKAVQYNNNIEETAKNFSTRERYAWHQESFNKNETLRKNEFSFNGIFWSF